MTVSMGHGFLAIEDTVKLVLNPLTQPQSWMLEGALFAFTTTPWWILIPLLILAAWAATRKIGVVIVARHDGALTAVHKVSQSSRASPRL